MTNKREISMLELRQIFAEQEADEARREQQAADLAELKAEKLRAEIERTRAQTDRLAGGRKAPRAAGAYSRADTVIQIIAIAAMLAAALLPFAIVWMLSKIYR